MYYSFTLSISDIILSTTLLYSSGIPIIWACDIASFACRSYPFICAVSAYTRSKLTFLYSPLFFLKAVSNSFCDFSCSSNELYIKPLSILNT